MPNWVYNAVRAKDIMNLPIYSTDENGNLYVDFNKVIPMPKELDMDCHSDIDEQMEAADIVDLLESTYGIVLTGNPDVDYPKARKAILEMGSPMKILTMVETVMRANRFSDNYSFEKMIADGRKYRENQKVFGFTTWYDWCVSNWGTKWNAERSGYDVDFDLVVFETAWDPPIPVLVELSKQVPDTEIDLKFADENEGFHSGHYRFLNGKMTGKMDKPKSKKSYRRYGHCMEAIAWCLKAGKERAKTVSSES